MTKSILTLLTATAMLVGNAYANDVWQFTVISGGNGASSVCGDGDTLVSVPCAITADAVPYSLAVLTTTTGSTVIEYATFTGAPQRTSADDDHLVSFVPSASLPLSLDFPAPDSNLLVQLGINQTSDVLSGHISAYGGRAGSQLWMDGFNNLWIGGWVTTLQGPVHLFIALSSKIVPMASQ